jgi:hypothetical protein
LKLEYYFFNSRAEITNTRTNKKVYMTSLINETVYFGFAIFNTAIYLE